LNDVITKITGVVVRETVPDSMLERAHEAKLVDLPPDDLLERLREGKVYVPAQAQRAIETFFKKGNLIALRELALRHTAERVNAQMQAYRRAQGIEQTWAVAEQILVAVSPSPSSVRLIRAARRMASALHARWYAVYVEPSRSPSKENQARLSQNLRLAQQLGAEVVTLSGEDASEEILRFAREHDITKIIVGKPVVARMRDRFKSSLVDQMVRKSRDIDVYVTAGDPEPGERIAERPQREPIRVPGFLAAAGATLLSTAVAWFLFGRAHLADVVMTYLLGIVIVSARMGFGPSAVAALLGIAAFDFVFVPPYLTFVVVDLRHAVTFAVMFGVGMVISGLTQRVRNQAATAREREKRTAALYELSRELAAAQGTVRVIELAAHHLQKVFGSRVSVFRRGVEGRLERVHGSAGGPASTQPASTEGELSVSEWVWSNRREAGLGTGTLPDGDALYVPLMASGGIVGVLGLTPDRRDRFDDLEQRRQVDAFAAQMAMALERAELSEETEKARMQVETERLRSSLLSSVSHDLRTPLAVITGAASTVLESSGLDEGTRRELIQTVLEEAERLNHLIRNLLDMTRLESGAVTVNKEWLSLEEVIGAALNRLEARLEGRDVRVEVPPDLPLVPFDAILIELCLINLLENAAKYGSDPIEVTARALPGEIVVEVADRGRGIPPGQELQVFEKFHRAVRDRSQGGVGLGLTICRAIVAAHGGRIWAQNRDGGGASFQFALPFEGGPPELTPPDAIEPPEQAMQ
jgi:two-component system sensor histidine kinase KdpD